ncbi:MAG: hypothetical protein K2X81_20030 [Candidatus Obscuribacterales bacterium]|nr:hypothetical protein [Candidatus Obscuribacterales bacterium]
MKTYFLGTTLEVGINWSKAGKNKTEEYKLMPGFGSYFEGIFGDKDLLVLIASHLGVATGSLPRERVLMRSTYYATSKELVVVHPGEKILRTINVGSQLQPILKQFEFRNIDGEPEYTVVDPD